MKILKFIGLTILIFLVLDIPFSVLADFISPSAKMLQAINAGLFIVAVLIVIRFGRKIPWKKFLILSACELFLLLGFIYFVNSDHLEEHDTSAKYKSYTKLQVYLETESESAEQCYKKKKIDESSLGVVFAQMRFAGNEIPEPEQKKIIAEILNEISAECDKLFADYEAKYEEWIALYEVFNKRTVLEYSIDFSPSSFRYRNMGTDFDLENRLIQEKL